jgi:hypothetical protein
MVKCLTVTQKHIILNLQELHEVYLLKQQNVATEVQILFKSGTSKFQPDSCLDRLDIEAQLEERSVGGFRFFLSTVHLKTEGLALGFRT